MDIFIRGLSHTVYPYNVTRHLLSMLWGLSFFFLKFTKFLSDAYSRVLVLCSKQVEVVFFSLPFFSEEPTSGEHLISTRSLLYGDGVVTAGSDGR